MEIKDNYFQNSKFNTSQRLINEKASPKKINNDILYALISIYYYEKILSLNTKKDLIFNENKIYYLINPNWIINFKKYFNYQMLSQILKLLKLKGMPITYYNFGNNLDSIKNYLSQNNFSLKNDEIPDNLKVNISASQRKFNNLVYYPYCYIIDIKIKNIIQNYVFQGNKLNICGQKVFAKDNFIYLKYSKNIMSGNFDGNFIFITNYVLVFNSSEILLNEKNFLLKYSFSDYLKYKHIDKFNSNKQQLKDENNNPIGEIILIPKNKETNKSKVIIQSASKKKFIESKLKENFNFTLPNVIFNNTVKRKTNNSIKFISKGNERKCTPQCNLNSRKFNINQSQPNKPKDDISSNNMRKNHEIPGITLNDKKLNNINVDKDDYIKALKDNNKLENNYFVKINPNQNKIVEYGLNNDIKIEENICLKQKMEKNDINLRKDVNELQKQMENIQNNYDNKFNKFEKELENNNKVNNDLYKKINNFEALFKRKEQFINNQNETITKKNELEKRENKLIEKENYLNKRENIISQKEDELIKNQNNLIKRENIISQKEDELVMKEYVLDEREKEINNKLKDLSQNNKKSKDEIILMPIPPVEPDPISSYEKPTLIGLNNIGATNFINCTIQCLSQTPYLTNYFLKSSKKCKIINNNLAKENKNSLQLSPIYLKLIQKLWDKKGAKSFSPNEFMNTIEKMNPIFKKGQAGDSKDFIIFILDQMHKELKKKINKNYNVVQPLNQYDKKNAFNSFLNDFSKNCSIISDAFFGFNEITNECVNCKNYYNSQNLNNPICYNYGIFNCLIFPLEKVKNNKNDNLIQYFYNMNNNLINNNQNNSVTLDDCFSYNQKTELFTGENKNYCKICKQLYDFNYTSRIYSSPNNLIIILNRGKYNIYNIKLYFNETIDITQYVVRNDGNKWIYNLYGVITHNGQSGPNGHFVASCKSPIDNKWYKYNDAFVNPINDVQNEVINFGTPYILFYKKK